MCKVIRKHLTSIDVPFTFVTLPPGPKGWEMAEQETGKRAVPYVKRYGEVISIKEFKAEVDALHRTPRELTQDELDEIL